MTRRAPISAFAGRPALWTDAPAPGLANPALLPAAFHGAPPVAFGVAPGPPDEPPLPGLPIDRVRADLLFWPATRADAVPAAAVIDLRGLPAELREAALDAAEPLMPAVGLRVALAARADAAEAARARGYRPAADLASVDPVRLEALLGIGAPPFWAALSGARGWIWRAGEFRQADPSRWIGAVRFRDPWRGTPVGAQDGLDALAELRRAAQRNDRPVFTAGLSRWKRRNVEPFLTGPCGPPRHLRKAEDAAAAAEAEGGRLALWGMREAPATRAPVLRIEDGFVRSVGLGLRHAPPASLAIDDEGLYFDATRPTSFERIAREARFDAALLARARALRERLVALRITKYNLASGAALPDADRPRLLVPGQVEGDASLRYGSPDVFRNADLLRRARARNPDAFLLYKPHPDVLTGMRPGAVDDATLAECADATIPDASAEACLDWADKVETMTSLMGFEALLRGKTVAVHGRPFYAGWGLTEDASGAGFDRGRALTLDELTAAALILYPRCIDPETRLPCPPERVLEALAEERAAPRGPRRRLRDAIRAAKSRVFNVVR